MLRIRAGSLTLLFLPVLWVGLPGETLCAQEPPRASSADSAEPRRADRTALLDAWSSAWTPGEAHARLAGRAGVWRLTTRTWGDPEQEPVVSETTAVREMILGGRVLQEQVLGEVQGFPFESLGQLGYDNVTGRWWSTWMDTLSTAVVVTTGTRDPRAGDLVLTGEYADLLTGTARQVRTVLRWIDADTERFEWWETREGEEVKTMEILYQRQ